MRGLPPGRPESTCPAPVKSPAPARRANTLHTVLGERDRAVIDFERCWWLYPGPKDRAVGEFLGMSATRYYQVLRRLLDDAEAERYDPLTIRRLRRVREQARRKRVEGRLDGGVPGD